MTAGIGKTDQPVAGDGLVVLDSVRKSYPMGAAMVEALRGVSLTIAPGEYLAIMGPSGCGKTTMLNIVGGIDTPTSGEIRINGISTSKLSDRELTLLRLNTIGFIFQQFYLIPTLTAFENVELPMREAGMPRDDRRARAEKLLEGVGLAKRLDHFPNQLSGGEQQRVAIARALANRPRLVLADEPTGELDSETALKILALLRELNRKEEVAFIIVTHDPSVAESTDRIVRLRDGQVVDDRPAAGTSTTTARAGVP